MLEACTKRDGVYSMMEMVIAVCIITFMAVFMFVVFHSVVCIEDKK